MENVLDDFTTEEGKRIIIINESVLEKGTAMKGFHDFVGSTVFDILNMAKTLEKIPVPPCVTFTSNDFDSWVPMSVHGRDGVSLQTLRKHGLVVVDHQEKWNVYTRETCGGWDTEVLDITDEQYENLPKCFKDEVSIESRKRNHYRLNCQRYNDFFIIVNNIKSVFAQFENVSYITD